MAHSLSAALVRDRPGDGGKSAGFPQISNYAFLSDCETTCLVEHARRLFIG
jgi:hypothetical protein